MDGPPTGRSVPCPECDETAIAVVPRGSKLTEREADADGKVRVTCRSCDAQFLVHYRIDG